MSCGRNGLRKQVTEAKEGPLELRRERPGIRAQGKEVGKGAGKLHGESHPGSSVLRLFIWQSQGRIPVEYSLAFQVCPFRVMFSTDWLALGQEGVS